MNITMVGRTLHFPGPLTLGAVVQSFFPDTADSILGCYYQGRALELGSLLDRSGELSPITYEDEEGRRIYERSLRFVFLLAVGRLFPGAMARVEHSIGQGIYIELHQQRLTPGDVSAIEAAMRDIVREDLPLVRERWTKEKAISYFEQHGDPDKARLLGYRPYDYFNVYLCDGMAEYFYGAMLPSTGRVPVFRAQLRAPGLVLLLPDKADPARPAPFMSAPKHMAAFAQSNYWCKVLNCATAADLNGLIAGDDLRDFIRVNEAFHDKSLSEIAQDILNRNARAIFIAGPSSSGKTTFAKRLSIHLRVNGLKPVLLSLDDFYLDRDSIPPQADGKPDLEALDTLDLPLLRTCLHQLLSGQETLMPRFSFITGKREPEPVPLTLDSVQPLIIEGIHGLNPALHEGIAPALLCRIYISQLTTLNLDHHNRIRTTDARLLRRIVRDYKSRDTAPEDTLAMWDSVRRGEEKWIFPFQEEADIVFNSALHYELPILKGIAYDMLSQVPKTHPDYIKCSRILKILNYFLPVDPSVLDEIPPLSILREFIGGNTLYTHPGKEQ
ncbi:MAG: nucleoside kinase [Christensenellales bacterium]